LVVSVLGELRDGARRYNALLALPGARGPVLASVLGSMPIGMFGLAILLLARDATGSFAEAGRVAGAFGLANAFGAVAQGRLMDRLGQTRVLRTAAVVHFTGLAGVVVAAGRGAPVAVMAAGAVVGGAALPQVPAAMRSLWGDLVADPLQRQTAYALVSIVFEVAVMTAPALVALLAALASPGVALMVAATLCSAGGLSFAATRGSRRWRGEVHAVGWLGPLGAAGMRTVCAVLVAFGIAVGIVQVAVPAFALERGSEALAVGRQPDRRPRLRRPRVARVARGPARGPRLCARCGVRAPGAGRGAVAAGGAADPRRARDGAGHGRRLDAAGCRRASRDRHRGVRGDGDGDRRRHRRRQRARRRARGGRLLRRRRADRGRDRGARCPDGGRRAADAQRLRSSSIPSARARARAGAGS
jgi:MFS family permease